MAIPEGVERELVRLRERVEEIIAETRQRERLRIANRIRDRAIWYRERAVIEDSLGCQGSRALYEGKAYTLNEMAGVIERYMED